MHDILFSIPLPGGHALPVHSYGVMAMIGFLVGVLVARWRARQVGISPDTVTDVSIWALMAGIVGSRIAYVISNSDYFLNTARPGWSFFDLFKIWEGGLVFYGGFIGAVIVILILLRIRKERLLAVVDVLAPSLALGHAFGRVGCFLRGCCYGVPWDHKAWCTVVYPPNALAYDPNSLRHIPEGTPIFASQLFDSASLLLIFLLLTLFFKRRRAVGEVTALYFILYGISRFVVEFFRGDTHLPGQFSPAQWISIIAFFVGLTLFAYLRGSAPRKARSG